MSEGINNAKNGDYIFYTPEGKLLKDSREFVNYYNARYFVDCKDKVVYKTSQGNKRAVIKNSRYAELVIEKILEKKPREYTDSDVALILAWKIGKIKHADSEGKIKFHSDWEKVLGNYEDFHFTKWKGEPLNRYNAYSLNVKEIANYIRNEGTYLNELIQKDDVDTALEELRCQKWEGIGSVYLITLLYFISNGKCPIYDRFAMQALKAISESKRIGDSVECGELPDKSSKNFSCCVGNRIKEYAGLMKDIFGEECMKKRNIDRALWVYGHLFIDSNKGKTICC